jgi:CubicO group peptidase (beta-lactamase class C family)
VCDSAVQLPMSTSLPRSSPLSQNVDQAQLETYFAALRRINEMHSVMLVRHGAVVAEAWWSPYAPKHEHVLFSLSKSFAAAGIGLLADEGRLSLDAPLLDFVREEAPPNPSENLKAMTIEHVLMMGTGHDSDTTPLLFQSPTWTQAFLNHPVVHPPGSQFVYNSGATYMLSVVVQKITGQRLIDYLRPQLFEPLGITGGEWQRSPQGYDTGGWGLKLKTEDIAKFGLLYVNKGMFNGKRVLSEAWVERASRKHIQQGAHEPVDWRQGYGYQFWRSQHNNYRGDGAFGQFCIMMPDEDAVLAITSSVDNMQEVLDAAWTHLLPALKPGVAGNSDGRAYSPGPFAITRPAGETSSSLTDSLDEANYTLENNTYGFASLQLAFNPQGGALTLVPADPTHGAFHIPFGYAEPVDFASMYLSRDGRAERHSCTGYWRDANTLHAHLIAYETPFTLHLTLAFGADTVQLSGAWNRSGPIAPPPFEAVGRRTE